MWQIIKAEIKYLKYGQALFVIPVTLVTLILIYKQVNVINMVVWMTSLIIVVNIIGVRTREFRSIREAILPLNSKNIALIRSLLVILPSTFLFSIGIAAQLIYSGYHEQWYDSIYELITMFALINLGTGFYFYLSDTNSLFASVNGKIVFIITSTAVILILFIIIIVSIKNIFNNSFFGGVGGIIFLLLASTTMLFINIYSYYQRESLLD